MCSGTDIAELFFELSRSDSVESALRSGLRLLCGEAACSAGLVIGGGWTSAANVWVSHGPIDQVDRLSDLHTHGLPPDPTRAGPASHVVSMPLMVGSRELGSLWLIGDNYAQWSPAVQARVEVLRTVLATLMAAADVAVADPTDHVLGSLHFRMQLDREVARSKRFGSEFSLVLARLETTRRASGDVGASRPWRLVASLGAWLAQRLRANDAVGLIAPHLLGILLPETGRLGATIAVRRIEELLPAFAQADADVSCPPGSWRLATGCYPRDGGNADALIESALVGLTQREESPRPVTPLERQTVDCREG